METYDTAEDAIKSKILPYLGAYAEDYDVESIFEMAFDYDDDIQKEFVAVNETEFAAIVARCEKK